MKPSARLCLFLFVFCAAYTLIEKSGLVGVKSATFTETFFSWPFLAGATALGVCVITTCVMEGRSREKSSRFLLVAAILMVLGLWISYLTRIDLDLVLTEGQSVVVTRDNVRSLGGYAGKWARFPDLYIKLLALKPQLSADRKALEKLGADYILLTKQDQAPRRVKRNSGLFPDVAQGFRVTFGDFGYSLLYDLKGPGGEHLDSAFVYLNVGFPGKEDYFRLMSPHTYYVRYTPGGAGQEGALNLRVTRNKDLVLNREVKLNEQVTFDGENISFVDVKQWTKFRIVRDYGQLLCLAGLLCIAAWAALISRDRKRGPSRETADGR
ncbi:MAG TPA: hypothetical protein VI298_09565 [Geobacteraceae bacterium]